MFKRKDGTTGEKLTTILLISVLLCTSLIVGRVVFPVSGALTLIDFTTDIEGGNGIITDLGTESIGGYTTQVYGVLPEIDLGSHPYGEGGSSQAMRFWWMFEIIYNADDPDQVRFVIDGDKNATDFDYNQYGYTVLPVYSLDDGDTWTRFASGEVAWDHTLEVLNITKIWEQPSVLLAQNLPYLYSDIDTYLDTIDGASYVTRSTLTQSAAERDIELVSITDDDSEFEQYEVVVIGRQHPGEVYGSYIQEGMIQEIMDTATLRAYGKWHFITPMQPDGVYEGANRIANGRNTNVEWESNPYMLEDFEDESYEHDGDEIDVGGAIVLDSSDNPTSGTQNAKVGWYAGSASAKDIYLYEHVYLDGDEHYENGSHYVGIKNFQIDEMPTTLWQTQRVLAFTKYATGTGFVYAGVMECGANDYFFLRYRNHGTFQSNIMCYDPKFEVDTNYNLTLGVKVADAGQANGWAKLWINDVLECEATGLEGDGEDREPNYAVAGFIYSDFSTTTEMTFDDMKCWTVYHQEDVINKILEIDPDLIVDLHCNMGYRNYLMINEFAECEYGTYAQLATDIDAQIVNTLPDQFGNSSTGMLRNWASENDLRYCGLEQAQPLNTTATQLKTQGHDFIGGIANWFGVPTENEITLDFQSVSCTLADYGGHEDVRVTYSTQSNSSRSYAYGGIDRFKANSTFYFHTYIDPDEDDLFVGYPMVAYFMLSNSSAGMLSQAVDNPGNQIFVMRYHLDQSWFLYFGSWWDATHFSLGETVSNDEYLQWNYFNIDNEYMYFTVDWWNSGSGDPDDDYWTLTCYEDEARTIPHLDSDGEYGIRLNQYITNTPNYDGDGFEYIFNYAMYDMYNFGRGAQGRNYLDPHTQMYYDDINGDLQMGQATFISMERYAEQTGYSGTLAGLITEYEALQERYFNGFLPDV